MTEVSNGLLWRRQFKSSPFFLTIFFLRLSILLIDSDTGLASDFLCNTKGYTETFDLAGEIKGEQSRELRIEESS